MATALKEGERVEIVDREANADDVKSGLFYNFFRGLTGTVQKVYATDEISVEIEQESLPDAVANRHTDVQETMKAKWLDGLSEEGRNRLTDKERDFKLHYTLLVHAKDLKAPSAAAIPAGTRATSADLAAAEQAYLESRKQTS
jgi:ribosomal protein L21E